MDFFSTFFDVFYSTFFESSTSGPPDFFGTFYLFFDTFFVADDPAGGEVLMLNWANVIIAW